MSDKPEVSSDALRVATEALCGGELTAAEREGVASHEHLDVIDNVLKDTSTSPTTRRWLLKRAATGAALAGAVGLMDPVGTAFARTRARTTQAGTDTPQLVGTIAVTAETFAVTYLTALLYKSRHKGFPHDVVNVLRAADVAEFNHRQFLLKAGFTPLTSDFYLPESLFGPTLKHAAAVIETAETLFINAYLIGITVFAAAGNPTVARYAGEILGVEAEHRALARFVQGKLPDNVAFEGYRYTAIDEVVAALEHAGVGFGKPTKKGGHKYRYHGLGNAGAGVHVHNHHPS